MNIDRLTTIAEWLEAGAPHRDGVDGFDMSTFIRRNAECGTACCIAGATVMFFDGGQGIDGNDVDMNAEDLLCLTPLQAEELFFAVAGDNRIPYGLINPAWAARCIRKLIATGVVDWEGTREEGKP